MIDGVGVLMLDLAVELVIAALGPLSVGIVFGLGHLLGSFFELVLELDQRGEARPGDFDRASARARSRFPAASKLTRIPGRTKSRP